MTVTTTTPDFASATSVTLAAANQNRQYLLIQNNSAAAIMISLNGATLSGIAPTASNKGLVIPAGGSYEIYRQDLLGAPVPSGDAITGYHTQSGTINTVVVVEG